MDKYQKIKDLGLEIKRYQIRSDGLIAHCLDYVDPDDLLKVLDTGVEVNGYEGEINSSWWDKKTEIRIQENLNRSGLVIGIKKLKPKEVTITRADLYREFQDIVSSVSIDELVRRLGL